MAVSPSSIFIRGSPLYSRPGAAYSSSSRSLYTPPLNSCLSDTGRCHSVRVHRHSDWRKPESLHFLEDSTEYSRTQHDWFRRFCTLSHQLRQFPFTACSLYKARHRLLSAPRLAATLSHYFFRDKQHAGATDMNNAQLPAWENCCTVTRAEERQSTHVSLSGERFVRVIVSTYKLIPQFQSSCVFVDFFGYFVIGRCWTALADTGVDDKSTHWSPLVFRDPSTGTIGSTNQKGRLNE